MTDAGPLTYPRIPHLPGSAGVTANDLVLSARDVDHFLTRPVLVEEKLDGANVTLWLDAKCAVRVSSRGGLGAMDRSGQLAPLRAWAAGHADSLRSLLRSRTVLYGEWLWFAHGIRYERLPEPLVAIDLLASDGNFADVAERDEAFSRSGVIGPPRIFAGVLHSGERLSALLGASRFGAEPAEGLIVRRLDRVDGEPRLAKLVAPTFRRRSDEEWRGPHERNRVLAS